MKNDKQVLGIYRHHGHVEIDCLLLTHTWLVRYLLLSYVINIMRPNDVNLLIFLLVTFQNSNI